jgi:hypothetical protein
MLRDLYSDVKCVNAINAARVTDNTAQVGPILDTSGARSVTLVVTTGTIADAACTITPLIEDGDNSALSDNAAVSDDFLLGTEVVLDQADDDSTLKIGVISPKRYVRLTLTPAANTGNLDIAAVWVVEMAKKPQTSQQIAS